MKQILFILLAIAVLPACKKEGCIDTDAVNYNVDAKKDDGSCTYESSKVIWYNATTSTNLINDGATTLTYYVDGQLIGSTATNVYWTGTPDCGANGSITVDKDLGGNKTQSYSYEVKDQTGWVYWSGTLNFNANTCEALELTF